jgi:hypothetical protein
MRLLPNKLMHLSAIYTHFIYEKWFKSSSLLYFEIVQHSRTVLYQYCLLDQSSNLLPELEAKLSYFWISSFFDWKYLIFRVIGLSYFNLNLPLFKRGFHCKIIVELRSIVCQWFFAMMYAFLKLLLRYSLFYVNIQEAFIIFLLRFNLIFSQLYNHLCEYLWYSISINSSVFQYPLVLSDFSDFNSR